MSIAIDKRISEMELVTLVSMADSVINSCKNQISSALTQANAITAADQTRLGLTDQQKAQLVTFKTKVQVVYNAIIAQGF